MAHSTKLLAISNHPLKTSIVFLAWLFFAALAYAEPVPFIIDVRDDLKLTERQQSEIKTIYMKLYRARRFTTAKTTVIDFELEELIDNETPVEQIRKKLLEQSDLRINMRIQEIETTRKVDKLLSPEQLKRWRTI